MAVEGRRFVPVHGENVAFTTCARAHRIVRRCWRATLPYAPIWRFPATRADCGNAQVRRGRGVAGGSDAVGLSAKLANSIGRSNALHKTYAPVSAPDRS
jgi:hypothetical protein